MKKLLAIAVLFGSTMGYAQNRGGAVMLTPDVGQGYLVLNKAEHPDVNTWVIEVNTRTFDQNNQPTDKTLDKVVLKNDINYWSVPEKVSESKNLRFIDVTGFDSNDNPVISEGPIVVSDHPETALEEGGSSWVPGCTWDCNGTDYAWQIQQYVDPDNPFSGFSRYRLQSPYTVDEENQTSVPTYYLYMNASTYQDACSPGGVLTGLPGGVPCTPDGVNVIGPLNGDDPDISYVNATGEELNGAVMGIRKTMGNWDGPTIINTGDLTNGLNVCSDPISIAIQRMNSHADELDQTIPNPIYPPLQCVPAPGVLTTTGSSIAEPGCLPPPSYSSAGIWPHEHPYGVEEGSFDELMQAISECLCEAGYYGAFPSFGGGSDGDDCGAPVVAFSDFAVERVIISDLNNPSPEPTVVDYTEIRKSYEAGNSDWIQMLEFTLEPSLYTFGISLNKMDNTDRSL